LFLILKIKQCKNTKNNMNPLAVSGGKDWEKA
jgi:hypothetical protein